MADNRKNLRVLFFTLVVVMLGFGMVIPIMPFYVKSFGASGKALGLLMSTYAIMQFIFAPLWGNLSDRYGRKPILMLGILGNALAQVLYGVSTQLWMLFLARALAGILSSATLPTAMAYVGDSTSERERGGGMGITGAALGTGMVLGPGLAGWLAKSSLSIPFFVAAALSIVALALVYLLLPESLSIENRLMPETQRQSRATVLRQALLSPIGILLLMAFLLSFGLTNFESVFGLFALERFDYGTVEVGLLLTFIGIISAVIQGALTGLLTKRWGEALIIKACLFFTAIGFVLMALAFTPPALVASIGFFVISNSMLGPATSSLTSKSSALGHGVSMGYYNAFMSLGRIIGPVWAGYAFDINLIYPYLTGAAIMLVGFLVAVAWVNGNPRLAVQPADP